MISLKLLNRIALIQDFKIGLCSPVKKVLKRMWIF